MAKTKITQTCSLTHCDLPHRANGYCNPHNQRILTHGDKADLFKPIRHHIRKAKYVGCKIDDCDGKHQAQGYCSLHYERWLDKNDPLFAQKGYSANPWQKDDPDFATYLWGKIIVNETCWEWQGSKTIAKYGTIVLEGRVQMVHRVSWELANGRSVAEGLFILHSCDNPSCINPEHLREGTQQDNMDDMVKRNRSHAPRTKWNTQESTIREIKRLRQQNVTVVEIAKRLNVGKSLVSHVSSGRTWKHVSL